MDNKDLKESKDLKIKLKVLEKLILTGLSEKDLTKFGAKEFFELYRKNKFSDRDGEVLLELIEAIKNKKLFSYLEVNSDNAAEPNKDETTETSIDYSSTDTSSNGGDSNVRTRY